MKLRNPTFGGKVTLLTVLCTTLALLVAAVAFVTLDVGVAMREIRRSLQTDADYIASACIPALRFDDAQTAAETLAILQNEPHVVLAAVYGADEEPFARYVRDPGAKDFPDAFSFEDFRRSAGHIELMHPIAQGDDELGTVYIRRDLRDVSQVLRFDALVAAGVWLGSLLLALLATNWLQRTLTRPINELVRTATAVTRERNYSLRARRLSEDELGALTGHFNTMLSEIQRRDAELLKAHDDLESKVRERTEELARTNTDLERFNRGAVGRELRMVELKREINALCRKQGEPPPYDLTFADAEATPDEERSA